MKHQKVLASIVLGGLAACAVGTAAWLPLQAYAEQPEADNVLYEENFDGLTAGETVGTAFTAEGGKIKSAEQFSKYDLNGKYTYDWKVSVDVVFPNLDEGSGFFGLNVNGMAEKTFEFTVEKAVGNAGYMFIKYDNVVIKHSGESGTNPELAPGTEYTYEVTKYRNTLTMSLDGVDCLTLESGDIEKTAASAMDIYSFNLTGMTADSLCVTRQLRETGINTAESLYSENFESYEAGAAVGADNKFTVTADKKIVSGEGYSQFVCGQVAFTDEWIISADVEFPADKHVFFGINVIGLQEGNTYEFSLEKKFAEGFSVINRHSSGGSELLYNSYLNNGSHPALIDNMVHKVALHKSHNTLTTYVDGKAVAFVTDDGITANGTEFNIFTTADGVKIDNIAVNKAVPPDHLIGVTLSADKQELSAGQSAEITAVTNPANASVSGYVWYVDGTAVDGAEGASFTYTASAAGVHYIKCTADGVESNTVAVKVKGEIDVTRGETLYTQNFDGLQEGDTVGENFTATADGKIIAGDGFAQYIAGNLDFSDDWILSADVNFPANKDGFIGINVNGLQADTTYEFTVQKTPAGGYSFIKRNPGDTVLYHSNDNGTNPVLINDLTYTVTVLKVGKTFTISLDGITAATFNIAEVTGSGSWFNIYTFNLGGVKVDNITVKEVRASTAVDEVNLSSDKQSISTMQSAKLTVTVLPSTALIESIVWKVDGVKVEGEEDTVFTYSSGTVGTHTVICVINGIESNEVTIEVTEASDEEKNSLYYESFETGSKWGSFDVRDGAAHTVPGSNYHRYDYNFSFVRDFEVTFNVTFNGEITNDAYVGFVATNLTNSSGEVEFNIHRAPATGTDASADNMIVKVGGVEKYFSNDSEKGGRLESLTLETGKTYSYRLVRYNDQFEMYIDGVLAIKHYMKDATSEPNIPSSMFFYTFNADCTSITIDDMKIKPAQEITDRVEPPVVEVESAYVTASSIAIKKGESSTLTVQSSPFDATVNSYAWYVNGKLIEGADGKNYVFTAEEAGEYVFKCVVNGTVESETKTVTVTEDKPVTPPADDNTDNKGLIIGLSVGGGVILLAAAGAAAGIYISKKRKK